MKESLSGISSELGKILQQLRDIESVQKNIGKGTSGLSRAVSVGGSSTSIGGSGFSTPPPAPGSQATGVMGTSAAGGVAAPGGESGGGGGMGSGIAGAFGALFTAGFNFLPSTQDSVAYQSAFFRSSFMGQGGYKEDDLAKMRAMFGDRQTDPFGMITAANAATMSGMGIGTSHFSTVMRQTATTSLLFGQSNATAAQAQTSLYSGPTAGRLGNIGIFVSSLDTGDPRAFGDIIDQIWGRAYGSPNAKVPYESVMADLRGGYLGAWLRRNFSDNPALYDQIYQALVLKANANGRSLDYSDLTGKPMSSLMSQSKGQTSAMGLARGELGLSESNDPMYFASRGYGAQARAIEGAMDEMLGAWSASMDKLISATDKYADAMLEGNWLLESVSWLKGLGQSIGSNPVMNPLVLGPLGLLAGSVFGRAKGGIGTSTSDSILARLSKGEYVINARAAQKIGTENLDALNNMGREFGTAYASPAHHFAGGGSTGRTTLDGWSALAYGSKELKKFPVQGAPNFPNGGMWLLERDGIGQYLADFAAAYQAHPALGGGRLDLNKGASYGHADRPGAMGGGWSNHAAGVAMDLRHDEAGFPFRRYEYQASAAEKSAIEGLLRRFPKLEWGGHWNPGSIDEMHFEIRDPKTWGTGGHSPEGTTDQPAGVTDTPAPTVKTANLLGVVSPATLAGGRPNSFSLGGFTGGARGMSLGLGSSFSWLGGNLFTIGSRGGIVSGSGDAVKNVTEEPVGKGEENVPATGGVGSGSGPEWLYKYLVSKGLRGNTLHKAWVIGMRESSGNPKLQSKDKYGGSWTSAGPPHYDVGLFQINNRHLPTVQKRYGGDMRQMLDLEKNYDMTTHMSNNWNNLLAWALESDGQTFNWSMYNPYPSWAGASMANHKRLWGEYDKYNTQNYSEGAYRTHEGMAKIHEGEMVLPANVAERFREMMREMGGPRGGHRGDVNITLHIDKASDAEAERFARRVKKLLEEDSWESAMRTR